MNYPPDAFPRGIAFPGDAAVREVSKSSPNRPPRHPTIFPVPFRSPALPFIATLSFLFLSGCASNQSKPPPTLSDDGKALFGPSTHPAADGKGATPADDSAWSIVIVAFRGPDRSEIANSGLAKARTVGGLREAYLQDQGNTTVIAYGHYPSPDSAEAQADLKRIRAINVDGGQPFAGAVLAPPEGTGSGRMPELDLRRVRTTFGKDAIYTLQIAAYGRDDRKPPQSEKERAEFVRYAEDAAAQLRREGEQAFYYHGPNMSLVTIGVFGPEDFDPQHPEIRSDRLRAVEEAHPDNLLNGKGILVRVPGVPANSPKARRPAKSFLIVIPDDQ